MRKFVCRLLLTLAALASPAAVCVAAAQAQQQAESAAALFKAVDGYVRDRRAEMRAQGKMLGRDDVERLEREQKELAAKSAAKLAARGPLRP